MTNWNYLNDWASSPAERNGAVDPGLSRWNFDNTPASDTPSKSTPSANWPKADGSNPAEKGTAMSNTSNLFGNMPGANKFMDRLFKKADGIVWDLMSGRVGIQTKDGIATLEGEGDEAQINVNLLDQFGMGIPAFAQSTPVAGVNVGDIIFFGSSDRPGWVIEKKAPADPAKQLKFVLMKVDGTRSTWTPPKVSMLGMDSGVMVLRSLMSMLPGGNAGLQGMQSMLMPMMMMGQLGGDGEGGMGGMDMEAMIPMMLMGQMQATPVTAADGTVVSAPNPMAQMMPMMMMMGMMKKQNGGNGGGNGGGSKTGGRNPFNRD
jgi:hypothetical protein